ncbi:hypothetical protein E8E15_003010 [Penicillium rubens]|nr:hypothetical protein E8E15_003010 [Penicillium rubens]
MPRTESPHNGIIELFRPSEHPIDIDIVAVHGLQDHARRTWTHEASKVCWLSDLLPNYIKNARVLSWEYNAITNSLGGKTTGSDRILQHAGALIDELQGDRELEDATERPIIFIAEDFSPLVPRYHILFLWEQLRTDMKYRVDYIVDRESAAPILDGTDKCGIAADHRGICKFENVDSPGFKVVIVTLKRYCIAAPARIKERLMESANSLS